MQFRWFSPTAGLLAFVIQFAWVTHATAAQDGRPIKLSVTPEKRTVQSGKPFRVDIGLLDVRNKNARASKDYQISVEVHLPSGGTNRKPLRIPRGQSAANIHLSLTQPGINHIHARHPELREGATSVNVRPAAELQARNIVPPAAPAQRRPAARAERPRVPQTAEPRDDPEATRPPRADTPARRPERPANVPDAEGTEPVLRPRQTIWEFPPPEGGEPPADSAEARDTDSPQPGEPPGGEQPAEAERPMEAAPPPPPPIPPADQRAILQLDFQPQIKLLADGQDEATIFAFLNRAESFNGPVEIQFHNSAGKLEPTLLSIASGEFDGAATLTSEHPGRVTVRPVRSNPRVEINGPPELSVNFGPPIVGLRVTAEPAEFTVLDQTVITVELLDHEQIPVETDEPRQVHLSLDVGAGRLTKRDLTIPAGSSTVSTAFKPTSWGKVVISSSTPGLRSVKTDPPLVVTFPFLLLSFSAIGGLAGGVVAYWARKPAHWWRIVVGTIAGLLLFGIIDLGLLAVLPAVAVANPFGAFVLSAIGGWMGTEVLDLGRKRLGLGPSKAAG